MTNRCPMGGWGYSVFSVFSVDKHIFHANGHRWVFAMKGQKHIAQGNTLGYMQI